MHQDTIRSDFAADVKLIRCEQAGPPLAAALRSWKIAASVALLASGLVGRFSISPSGVPREHGEADVLYHNDGKGHFVPVSWIDGTFLDEEGNPLSTPPYDWGLGVMFRDLNGDGAPDLYVCNDSHSPDPSGSTSAVDVSKPSPGLPSAKPACPRWASMLRILIATALTISSYLTCSAAITKSTTF